MAEYKENMTDPRAVSPYWQLAYRGVTDRVLAELERAHQKFPDQSLPWGGGRLTFPQGVPEVTRDWARSRCDLALAEGRATWADVIAEEFFEANAERAEAPAVAELLQLAAMCFRAIADIEANRDPLRCPRCGSRQPSMHPAVSGGGEVTSLCPDAFHA